MEGSYEWDEDKADRNRLAHGVTFTEAITVFDDAGAVEEYDVDHSNDRESRYSRIGFSGRRLLFVVFTVRAGKICIIHAREADRIMERIYAKHQTR